jgi:UDP-2,4-diacetamido-2,4,6-trideoxy-beta-L-altropyranose hydrolase
LKTVVIRADASVLIGSGHITRCLAIADELRIYKWNIIFISRNLPGNYFSIITERSHKLIKLESPVIYPKGDNSHDNYSANLGVSLVQDANETINAIKNLTYKPDLLIIDHYSIYGYWEKLVKYCVKTILVIDDLAQKPHFCDFLLNQDKTDDLESSYMNLVEPQTRLLLGPKYSLLNSVYSKYRRRYKKKIKKEKIILIFFGSVDISNETEKTIKGILNIKKYDFIINTVIGNLNKNAEEIQKTFKNEFSVRFHKNLSNLADIMIQSDLFVGSGGSTINECLSLGLPALVTITAENQEPFINSLHQNTIVTCAGKPENINISNIQNKIEYLFDNQSILNYQSKKGMNLIDGKGVDRLCDILEKYL